MFISDKSMNRTWKVLLAISALLFFIVGIAMVVVDTRYTEGIQRFATALLSAFALNQLYTKKMDVTDFPKDQRAMFSLGFLIMILGVGLNMGVWAFGYILLLGGILGIEESKSSIKSLKDFFKKKK